MNRLAYYRKTFGWRGALVARCMSTLRGWEEMRKLRRAGAPPAAVARVRQVISALWARRRLPADGGGPR